MFENNSNVRHGALYVQRIFSGLPLLPTSSFQNLPPPLIFVYSLHSSLSSKPSADSSSDTGSFKMSNTTSNCYCGAVQISYSIEGGNLVDIVSPCYQVSPPFEPLSQVHLPLYRRPQNHRLHVRLQFPPHERHSQIPPWR